MIKPLSKLILASACALSCTVALAQEPTPGEEIDLGLSVNWRAYNIGASAPEEKGTVYAYASTKAGGYSMQYSYPYFDNLTWTCKLPEGNLAGNVQYDAAALETDGRWRMATKEQWEELLNGCDITAYQYNNVAGALLTSKANGNSIFLPSATLGYNASCSYYTSESDGELPYVAKMAANQYQTSTVSLMQTQGTTGPWSGLPLRAVCDRYEGKPLEAINLTAALTEIFAGTSTTVTATSVPADVPMSLKYASSDESIATVSDKGVVRSSYGSKGGKVTITATSGNVSASVDIIVTAVETDPAAEVVDLGLSVDWCTADLGAADCSVNGSLFPFCYLTSTTLANAFAYKYYRNGSYVFPEEYFCGDKNYDAIAYYNAPGKAYAGDRLPSKAEVEELIANCELTYTFAGDEAAPESRAMIFVSKVNGKAIRFPMSASTQVFYTGSTTPEKNDAYSLYIDSKNVTASLETYVSAWKSYPLRGVVEHSTVPDLEKIELDVAEAEIYVENTIRLTPSPLPVGALLVNLAWESDNEDVATVGADGVVKGVGEGKAVITVSSGKISASAAITVKAVNLSQGETVDMGSGILWASRELNAPSQAENGSYYMFGNLTPMRSATSFQSQWVDPEVDIIGGTQFDPAHAELGGNWRMPTNSELLAMASNCEIEWITYGGKRGVLLSSTVTDGKIFCPLPSGTTYIFYMGDKLQRGGSSDGSPTVEGLYIAPTQAAMNAVRAWRACPILPVYDSTLGIDAPEVSDDQIVEVIALDGRILPASASLSPGVYILRYASGKTVKRIVK